MKEDTNQITSYRKTYLVHCPRCGYFFQVSYFEIGTFHEECSSCKCDFLVDIKNNLIFNFTKTRSHPDSEFLLISLDKN